MLINLEVAMIVVEFGRLGERSLIGLEWDLF